MMQRKKRHMGESKENYSSGGIHVHTVMNVGIRTGDSAKHSKIAHKRDTEFCEEKTLLDRKQRALNH